MAKKKEAAPPSSGREQELAKVEAEYRRELAIAQGVPIVKRVAIWAWTALDVVLVGIVVGSIVWYLVAGSFIDRRAVAQIGQNIDTTNAVSQQRAAQDILVDDAQVLSVGEGKYDFYAVAQNPNVDWYAQFSYYFTSDAGESDRYTGFLLPNDERPFIAFSEEFERRPLNASLVVEDLVWSRVDHHEIPDLESWLAAHKNFRVTDATYTASEIVVDSEPIARSTFTLTNATPYSYWSPVFYILLERAGSVVAVNATTLSGLEAGESRTVDVNWFGDVPTSATVLVVPNINYFDDSVYMSESGDGSEDVRDILSF